MAFDFMHSFHLPCDCGVFLSQVMQHPTSQFENQNVVLYMREVHDADNRWWMKWRGRSRRKKTYKIIIEYVTWAVLYSTQPLKVFTRIRFNRNGETVNVNSQHLSLTSHRYHVLIIYWILSITKSILLTTPSDIETFSGSPYKIQFVMDFEGDWCCLIILSKINSKLKCLYTLTKLTITELRHFTLALMALLGCFIRFLFFIFLGECVVRRITFSWARTTLKCDGRHYPCNERRHFDTLALHGTFDPCDLTWLCSPDTHTHTFRVCFAVYLSLYRLPRSEERSNRKRHQHQHQWHQH